MISGDRRLLEGGSVAHERLELQRAQVEQLDVLVWPQVHSLRDIAKAARATHYDVITAQDPFWRGCVAYFFARRMGAKLNLQLHTELSAQPLWRRLVGAYLLRRADTVRVVSQKIKDSLAPLGLRTSVEVLPIYLDLSAFVALAHRPHPKFAKVLLWVGRFEAEKDPLAMITILQDVRRKVPDAGLVMLGEGSLAGALRTQLSRVALDNWVEFPGWQAPQPFLAQADVVVSTSRYEGFGASIVEALAAGVPTVAPDVGVAREAGATVVPRAQLAAAATEVLQGGRRGALQLPMLSKEAWAAAWARSLS